MCTCAEVCVWKSMRVEAHLLGERAVGVELGQVAGLAHDVTRARRPFALRAVPRLLAKERLGRTSDRATFVCQ